MTKTETTRDVRDLNAEELATVSGGDALLAKFIIADSVIYINSDPLPLTNSHVAIAKLT